MLTNRKIISLQFPHFLTHLPDQILTIFNQLIKLIFDILKFI